MSHLGEEAEAFFKKGDEGTYEGGPLSLQPASRDLPADEDDDNLTAELIAGQLERRSRMQRLVTKIVGGLGACVLLLVPLRMHASHAAAASATESLGTITVSQPAAAAPPVQTPPPAPVVAAAAEPTVQAAPSATSDRAVTSSAQRTSESHKTHGTAVHSQRQGNRRAVLATRPTRTFAPVPLSHGRRSSPGPHAPPTATFPD